MERNRSIDLLKGLATLGVLLLHALPVQWLMPSVSVLHIGQSVPLFIVLQSYLFFAGSRSWSWRKVARRMVWPFMVAQLFLLAGLWCQGASFSIKGILLSGGAGPGSYYLWIYLQSLFVLSFLWLLLRWRDTAKSRVWVTIGWCVLAVALEVLCWSVDVSATKYRLLVVRYLPLYVLGYWLTRKVSPGWIWVWFFVGALASVVDVYTGVRWWVLPYWHGFHGFCFLYAFALVCWFGRVSWRNRFFEWCGRWSWQLFLVQMVFYGLWPCSLQEWGVCGALLFCFGSIGVILGVVWVISGPFRVGITKKWW